MPRQELSSGEPTRGSAPEPNAAEDVAAQEARIAELIAAGEAVDRVDAERAINEGIDLVRFCERDCGAYLADLNRVLNDPETEPIDRGQVCFWKAAAEVAQDAKSPRELEFMANNVLRDFEFGAAQDSQEQARLASTQRRLDKKIDVLVDQLGIERAQALTDQYRRRLQELIGQDS